MDSKDTSLTHDNLHIEPDTSGDIYPMTTRSNTSPFSKGK